MDGSLRAAVAAALNEADQTVLLANSFVHDITSSQEELEPVLVELFGLGSLLKQLQDVDVPGQLQPSTTRVIWACADVCRCMNTVLTGCGEGTLRSRRWALTDAPAEIEGMKANLHNCMRTLELVIEALKVDNSAQILDDIDDLQKDLTPGLTQLDALLVDCLEALDSLVTGNDGAGYYHDTSTSHSHKPPISDTTTSIQNPSLQSPRSKDPVLRVVTKSEYRATPKALAVSPLKDTDDDDIFHEPIIQGGSPRSSGNSREHQTKRARKSLPGPNPLLSPPAYPPPARALPPIPPPRSPMRRKPILSTPPTSPSSLSSKPPTIPARSRERAISDTIRDSKFSALTLGTSRFSGSSQASSTNLPPRSSSHNYPESYHSLRPDTLSGEIFQSFEVVASRRLDHADKDASQGGVYCIDTSPASTCMASRHGKFHIKLWDLPSGPMFTTIKVPFYVQIQPRSREFFIRSHAILSETLNLIAIATGFGQTLEIWNWAKKKKVQSISHAFRWTAVRAELQDETHPFPLATYREDEDSISLYPACATSSKKPFGKPRVIDLRMAGLPHLPKLPELAYSATGPLLVAAAGPRPPRPGAAPPAHAALLMAWRLDGGGGALAPSAHKPFKVLETTAEHRELGNSLPLCLATYGSVAVSIWEPAKFRTIGRPGAWQVEPVPVPERIVLVWDFSVDRVTTYRIPHVLSCVSPDCRFVAYCDPGGGDGDGALVVLDATQGGRELWRLDGGGGWRGGGTSSRRSGKSFETRRSARSSSKSDGSSIAPGSGGLGSLAAELHKVTELAFSGDGKSLFVGDVDGGIGVYELREGPGVGLTV